MDLKKIEQDIVAMKPFLAQAADIILTEDVSRYPIFVVSRDEMSVGVALGAESDKYNEEWYVRASTLEEFYVKKMIETDKIDEFRKAYQSPETHLCLFVIEAEDAKFIFINR